MRELLTILAALVLAVLAAALVLPPFVDWSAYAPTLSARLGQTLRARTTLAGPISVRLLPSPRFTTGAIIAERRGVSLEADGADLELSLAPLLRGTITVTSARLERARLSVDLRAAQTQTSAVVSGPGADLGIEQLTLQDATVSLVTEAGVRRVEHVDVVGSAEGAGGPFKADGFVRAGTRLLPFHLATGAIDAGRLPLKLTIDPLAGLPRADVTGHAIWTSGRSRFEGSATLVGEIERGARDRGGLPWHARMDAVLSGDGLQAKTVTVQAGRDDARLSATGSAQVDAAGQAQVSLTSEHPDLDRFRTVYDPAVLRRAAAVPAFLRSFDLAWRTDDAVLGGEIVSKLALSAQRAAGDPPERVGLSGSLAVTRGGFLSFAGATDGSQTATGDLVVRTADAPSLRRWLADVVPNAPAIPDLRVTRADVAAHLAVAPGRVEASGIAATLDRSRLTGRVAFVTGTPRPKLDADFHAEPLDLDALPDLARLRGAAGDADLALRLDARTARVASVGRADLDTGAITLRVSRTVGVLALERLTLAGVRGANLELAGQITPTDLHLNGRGEARQLAGVAGLLRQVAPGAWTDALATRATVLSPATLDVVLDGTFDAAGGLAPTAVKLTGSAGDTWVTASLAPGNGGSAAVDAADSAALLRQLGLPVLPIRGIGPAHVEARIPAAIGAPQKVLASGQIAGVSGRFDGTATLAGGSPTLAGTLRVATPDAGPLLRLFAAPVSFLSGWPINATADLSLSPLRITMRKIDGQVAGVTVGGNLTRDPSGPIVGNIHLDALDAGTIPALLLGAPVAASPGRLWSTARFSAAPPDLPPAEIDLSLDRIRLPGEAVATGGQGHLSLRPGALDVTDARATLGGGSVSGAMSLQRQADTAGLRAKLSMANVGLALPWFSARVSGGADLAGAGNNPAALVGSLSGNGTLHVTNGSLGRADPDALLRVAAAADAERIDIAPDVLGTALARALDAAPHRLSDFDQPLTIAAGQASVGPIVASSAWGSASVAARLDLVEGRIELHDDLRPSPPPEWTGSPPTVSLTFAGPVTAPVRSFDAADLFGTLASHGIAREEARIAAAEADRRERSFFNRRLKFDRALDAERRAEDARAEAARREMARQDALRAEAARQELLRAQAVRAEAARQEALRAERERRAAERRDNAPAGTAEPLDLRPPSASGSGGRAPTLIAPDPGTAGRY